MPRQNFLVVYSIAMIYYLGKAVAYPSSFQRLVLLRATRGAKTKAQGYSYLAARHERFRRQQFAVLSSSSSRNPDTATAKNDTVQSESESGQEESSSKGNSNRTTTSVEKEYRVRRQLPENEITTTSSPDSSSEIVTENSISSYWSLAPRGLRKGAGRILSSFGFLASSATALTTDRAQFRRMKQIVEPFQKYLNSSGIYLEVSQSLNRHLLRDVIVLGRVQKILAARRDPREAAKIKDEKRKRIKLPTREEALRYMRYLTAVYGNNMILAAEMDARGKFDTRLSPLTRTRISEHIGVPEEDIVLVDVEYDGDGNHLRHFVAVDHVNKKVVLSIRGTFSLSEVVVDIAAFSRPCFGGEAHSEMYTMAERVWTAAGETVVKLLRENEGYEFIITGHSLGAGTACLLNIMCHRHKTSLFEGSKIRCFAYAAPPVFAPLQLIPDAVQSTTNFIHGMDAVPFLSVDSVRHVFSSVRVIEDYMTNLSRTARFMLTSGIEDPDEALIQAVLKASHERLKPKQGAPILAIPAAATIWMKEQETVPDSYDYEICDPDLLSTTGICMSIRMADDHLPPRYEHALANLIKDGEF